MQLIILDRSTLGYIADCPMQGYLMILLNAIITKGEGKEVFDWEQKMLDGADAKLLGDLKRFSEASLDNKLCDVGKEVHKLIQTAFKECDNDLEKIPDWFVENLPSLRPDIQPQAIEAARHVADMLADFHVTVLGVEQQVDWCVLPETTKRPAVVVPMCFDIIGSGLNLSLHAIDWKTGWKKRSNSETFESFQAQFGSWILWQQPNYQEIETVHWWYFETRFGTKAYAKFVRKDEHPRLPHLSTEVAIKGRIMEAVRLFLEGNKECWPEEQKCCWCDVISLCPKAHLSARKIDEDPCAYVDNMIVLTEHLKKMKKAATAWVKGKGAIEGTKVVFDKSPPSTKFTTAFHDKMRAKGPAKTGEPDIDKHFG